MSNDNMEKFFAGNRHEFDDKTPSDKIWSRISHALFGAKKVSLWNSLALWRSAAIILLGVSAYLFFVQAGPITGKEDLASQQEFLDVESYYTSQISEKVLLIRSDAYFIDEQFTQDFEKLEAMYAVLAEDLKKRPSEKVKDALVLNMLVRIDLLNQQIQKLEESKERKKNAAEV